MSTSNRSINTRTQEITAVLRTEILGNQYRPGERLPSERDLAARFNTNRGSIREVLKGLEQLGIISIQPGGARVVPKEEATLEILDYMLNFDGHPNPKLIDDYLQVFKMICIMSAEESVIKATEDQLSFICETIATMKTNPTDEETMREGWTTLFDYFLSINDNLVLRLVANGLKGQFLTKNPEIDHKPQIEEKAMLALLNNMDEAVKQRDSKRMGEFVGQYFEWVRKIFAQAFSDHQLSHKSITQHQALGR